MRRARVVVVSTVVYGGGMTDAAELRELVRARYAAAATTIEQREGCGCDDACCTDGACRQQAVRAAEAGGPDGCCSAGSCAPQAIDVGPGFGGGLYGAELRGEIPADALAASLGCGNPTAVAELRSGERVLDPGSGRGIGVLL